MAEPRQRPPAPLLALFPWVAAFAVGVLAYLVVSRPQEHAHPLAGALTAERTAAEERRWVDTAFPRNFFPSPLVPPPCGGNGRDWEAPLATAHDYISRNNLPDAEATLRTYLMSGPGRQLTQSITAAAQESGAVTSEPSTTDVIGVIHLLATSAYVLILENGNDDLYWLSLKNPIGGVVLLSRRGGLPNAAAGRESWALLSIPSGCMGVRNHLTTYHLYNNLIVGYLAHPEFRDTSTAYLAEEAGRRRSNRPGNPLNTVVSTLRKRGQSPPDAWQRALSNAQLILSEGEWDRPPEALEVASWLGLNLAQLLDSARVEVEGAPRDSLLDMRDVLAVTVARDWSPVAGQEQRTAQVLGRLLLLRAIRRGEPPEIPAEVRQRLNLEQRTTVDAVATAVRRRRDADTLEALVARGAADDSLGVADPERWVTAARRDLAWRFAERMAAAAPRAREAWARRAHGVLAPGDSVPTPLREREGGLNPVHVARRWPWTAGLAASALSLPFFLYLAGLLRHRKALWVSYYRVELLERLRDSA